MTKQDLVFATKKAAELKRDIRAVTLRIREEFDKVRGDWAPIWSNADSYKATFKYERGLWGILYCRGRIRPDWTYLDSAAAHEILNRLDDPAYTNITPEDMNLAFLGERL